MIRRRFLNARNHPQQTPPGPIRRARTDILRGRCRDPAKRGPPRRQDRAKHGTSPRSPLRRFPANQHAQARGVPQQPAPGGRSQLFEPRAPHRYSPSRWRQLALHTVLRAHPRPLLSRHGPAAAMSKNPAQSGCGREQAVQGRRELSSRRRVAPCSAHAQHGQNQREESAQSRPTPATRGSPAKPCN